MTSEEYIIKLMQTIESLHSTVQGFCEEIAMLRKQKAEDDIERRRLMRLIEAKDDDIRKMADRMTDLLGKVDVLTKALEDKTHQLANRNRGQFGTKTNRTGAKKNLRGRDDDHEDFQASSDTDTEKQAGGATDSDRHDGAEESKPLDTPKSDIGSPMDISEFDLKFGKERPDTYESAHADRVVRFGCDLAHIRTKFIDWIEVAADGDGRYSLDNNPAERCARPVALMRKNILHFASHKGAEVYSILGSLVESCRMKGQSVLRYLERVIQEINDGNRDYDSLLPGVLPL